MPAIYSPEMAMAGFGMLGDIVPAINYVARLDGATQYWQLSEVIPLIGSFRVVVNVFVFEVTGTSWVIDGETTNNRRFDVSVSNLDGQSVGLNQKDYMSTAVNGQQAVSAPTGETFELELARGDGTLDQSLREIFNVGARFDGAETLSGYVKSFKVYDENNILTHEIPLTNKAQGSTQLATVGNVNATMVGYTPDVWEVLPELWYNKTTGMVICSDKLIECNDEVIPCL